MSEEQKPNNPKKPYTAEFYPLFKCGNCGAEGKYVELEQLSCGMYVSSYKYTCTLCNHIDGVRFSE